MRIFYLLLLLVSVTSCFDSYKSRRLGEPSVCIWDGAVLRKEATIKSKQISTLNLGEKIYFLGKVKVDSMDESREYAKVRLSDDSIGWVHRLVMIEGAYIAAITKESPIYRRPDLFTLTKRKYSKMEIVAVRKTKDDWVEVFGSKKVKSGWISSKTITRNEEDVAFAILARKNLYKKGKLQKDKIKFFLKDVPYKASQFMEYLTSRQKINSVTFLEEATYKDTIRVDAL